MSDNTKIEWTDATANYVNGCSLVSPGCTNCYAMRLAGTRLRNLPSRAGLTQPTKAGPVWTGEVRRNEAVLKEVLGWKSPRRIFWNAHGDLFHPSVPDEWIDAQFAVMALTPHHTHQVLTKRPERMREYMQRRGAEPSLPSHEIMTAMDGISRAKWPHLQWPLPNVWLGTSVEDQARADERIPHLRDTPAAVRFVSGEPLLGAVQLDAHIEALDWVIVGGESGPGARPMHPDWARSLRDQCAAAGIPFHFKQWGEWMPCEVDFGEGPGGNNVCYPEDGSERDDVVAEGSVRPIKRLDGDTIQYVWRVGKKNAGRLLDGQLHDGFPIGAA